MTTQPFALAPINRDLSEEAKVQIYRDLIRCRAFDSHGIEMYINGHMGGFLMTHAGQEGIAVGVRSVMGQLDHSLSGMRGIAHALAAGAPTREMMAELFGRSTGIAKGKAGMLGFYSPEHRFWGNHGFAGTQTALAIGLAFGLKHRGETGAVLCFLGEGSMNQGVVHESLNLAGLMNLPVVFIIENNGYACGTSEVRSSATGGTLAQRAEGYGIAWDRCCGDGIYEVRATTHAAIQRAHHESRPTVLEMSTYRYEGFVIADAYKLVYRTKAEVMEHITHHDPVKLWADQLKAEGIVDQDQLDSSYAEAHSEAAAAVAFAKESAYPEAAAIFDHIYWAKDHAEVARPLGRHFF